MITSNAPGNVLDKLRRISGPNPEGSKLTEVERLHLIWLLSILVGAVAGYVETSPTTSADVLRMLCDRGISVKDVATIVGGGDSLSPIEVADAIAVHPNLREPYLD